MRISNIWQLGVKELRGLQRDTILIALIVFSFTLSIYVVATALPDTLNLAPIAIVDEDHSALSTRIVSAFYPPYFKTPKLITPTEMDQRMDAGIDTFAIDIPPNFERDVLAGRSPKIQLNIDATRMTQAFSGNGYIQSILNSEVYEFVNHHRPDVNEFADSYHYTPPPVDLPLRIRFNTNLTQAWFGAVINLIDNITIISIILTGAALIQNASMARLNICWSCRLHHSRSWPARSGRWDWSCLLCPAYRLSLSYKGFYRCQSQARSRCSWWQQRCNSSPPPPWAFTSRLSPNRCPNSGCC